MIATSLLFLAIPVFAAEYPQEIKNLIRQADGYFICKHPSSLSAKFYTHSGSILIIMNYAKKGVLISKADIASGIGESQFIMIKNEWKKLENLANEEENEAENLLQPIFNPEDLTFLQSCMESNLRSRGLR